MRGTWWVVIVTVPFAVAIGLPTAYGLAFGDYCAPPGIECLLPGRVCPAVCGHAWAQFPHVALVGAVTGTAPGLAASGLVFALERRRATSLIRRWALWTLSGIAAVAAVSVIAAVTTCAGLVFPGMALAVSSAVLAIANVIPGSLLELREVPTA